MIAAAAPGLALITYAMLFGLLVPGSRPAWAIFAGIYAVGLVVICGGLGTDGLGLAMAGTPAIQLLPRIVVVLRERRPVGLSPSTWAIAKDPLEFDRRQGLAGAVVREHTVQEQGQVPEPTVRAARSSIGSPAAMVASWAGFISLIGRSSDRAIGRDLRSGRRCCSIIRKGVGG